MNSKSKTVFLIFTFLISLFAVEILYINQSKTVPRVALDKKLNFVALTGLPDLAISTEVPYIRHRSLATVFSIYPDDTSLREYSYTSFATNNFKSNR